ncbi:MAG: SH3 domain-containing protein [Thermodesulfobacteriota bacterium]
MRVFIRVLALFFVMAVPAAGAGGLGPGGPSFWIGRLGAPDSVVLGPGEIEELNSRITGRIDQMADVAGMPDEVPGGRLLEWLLFDPVPGPDEPRFDADGEPLGEGFFEGIVRNMALDRVASANTVRFGVVVGRADVRAFPSDAKVIKRPGGFDTLQYSAIFPTEPVALLHTSRDGGWGFFQTRFVRGWIRLESVAMTDRSGLRAGDGRFIVVTGSSVPVYSDASSGREVMRLPMGTVLYVPEDGVEGEGVIPVWLPRGSAKGLIWKTGYVARRADVSEGYLPYTRASVISQAFKMFGEEYGWGGDGGLRDCSAYVRDVFASVGVRLPRNSRQQGAVGQIVLGRERAGTPGEIGRALAEADPGVTLLGLDGHIMLYLGVLEEKPYVIHQIWGYMDGSALKEIGKVAVTGLELGAGTEAGSLRERIKSVSEVRLPPRFAGQRPAEGL